MLCPSIWQQMHCSKLTLKLRGKIYSESCQAKNMVSCKIITTHSNNEPWVSTLLYVKAFGRSLKEFIFESVLNISSCIFCMFICADNRLQRMKKIFRGSFQHFIFQSALNISRCIYNMHYEHAVAKWMNEDTAVCSIIMTSSGHMSAFFLTPH